MGSPFSQPTSAFLLETSIFSYHLPATAIPLRWTRWQRYSSMIFRTSIRASRSSNSTSTSMKVKTNGRIEIRVPMCGPMRIWAWSPMMIARNTASSLCASFQRKELIRMVWKRPFQSQSRVLIFWRRAGTLCNIFLESLGRNNHWRFVRALLHRLMYWSYLLGQDWSFPRLPASIRSVSW